MPGPGLLRSHTTDWQVRSQWSPHAFVNNCSWTPLQRFQGLYPACSNFKQCSLLASTFLFTRYLEALLGHVADIAASAVAPARALMLSGNHVVSLHTMYTCAAT